MKKKAVDPVAKQLSKANHQAKAPDQGIAPPKKGDKFRCDVCGMEIKVAAQCNCETGHVHFHCCGQELTKV